MEFGDVLEAIPPVKNVSYLYARDPSILAWGAAGNCRKNLLPELGEVTVASAGEQEGDTLSTYLRIKTTRENDVLYNILDPKTLQCKIPEGSHAIRNVKEGNVIKNYSFTKIFSGSTSQSELFCEIVKPKMLRFLNGCNYTLLSYGASGSGKTYTIVGTAEQPGLIPRALEYVFRSLPLLPDEPNIKLKSDGTLARRGDANFPKSDKSFRDNLLRSVSSFGDYSQHIRTYREMQTRLSVESVAIVEVAKNASLGVFVSFAEIYNEYIYDLLTPQTIKREKLHLGSNSGVAYIKNLTMVPVSNGLQAFQILQYGLRNLNFASTGINDHSSRSHSIFTIKLVQASTSEEGYSVSYFNFCDLAGSERVKKTLNVGDRLKESNNINTSLLVLGRCIKAVRDSQKHKDNRLIPFRESKLTQLFKRALSGLEDISMIVNINPAKNMFDESHHVLNFSAIANEIIVERPQIKKSRFSNYMKNRSTSIAVIPEESEELHAEIDRLTNMVAQLEYENKFLQEEVDQVDQQTRAEVIKAYKEILATKEEKYNKKLNELKEEIARLKQLCETQQRQQRDEIIDLDSSDDSIGNDTMRDLRARLDEKDKVLADALTEGKKLRQELATCETMLDEKNEELQNLQTERKALRQELVVCKAKLKENEGILEDAVIQHDSLQQENVELKKEILKLTEELDMYKSSVKTVERSDDCSSEDEREEFEEDLIQWGEVDTKTEECTRYSTRKTFFVSEDNKVVEKTNGNSARNISDNDSAVESENIQHSNGKTSVMTKENEFSQYAGRTAFEKNGNGFFKTNEYTEHSSTFMTKNENDFMHE